MLFQDCFVKFCETFPKFNLFHTHLDLIHLQNLELIKQFDLIIAAPSDIPDIIKPDLDSKYLYNDDYPMLIVYPEHPFANRNSVDIDELNDERFISINKSLSSRLMFDEIFRTAGYKPNIVFECDHMLRERIILDKKGIGISTYQSMRANLQNRLVFVPLTNHRFKRIQLLWWYKRRVPSKASECFTQFAIDYYSKV